MPLLRPQKKNSSRIFPLLLVAYPQIYWKRFLGGLAFSNGCLSVFRLIMAISEFEIQIFLKEEDNDVYFKSFFFFF
jgi:hypothetical protein